jgi:ADP-ribosyl-[dinitrogen reductase] hydrolase
MPAIKTSDTHPIYVSWIVDAMPGKVGLTFAPGKHATSKYEGGRWERDLAKDLDKLVADGMGLQVCLLEDHELERLRIPRLVEEAQARGVRVVRLPIPDGGVLPAPEQVDGVVAEVLNAASRGTNVVIHCMGGLGRAGTVGGCVLVGAGLTASEALARLTDRRGRNCPENEAQRGFVRAFAARRLSK